MSTSTTSTTSPDARPRPTPRPAFFDSALHLCDDFSHWWDGARRPSQVIAAGILAVTSGGALLVLWSLLQGLGWVIRGVIHLVGHASITGTWLAEPLMAAFGMIQPSSDGTAANVVLVVWAAVGGVLWLGSIAGAAGARVGWAVFGAATILLAVAGSPSPRAMLLSPAAIAIAWAVLTLPAYWRTRRIMVLNPVDSEPCQGSTAGRQRDRLLRNLAAEVDHNAHQFRPEVTGGSAGRLRPGIDCCPTCSACRVLARIPAGLLAEIRTATRGAVR